MNNEIINKALERFRKSFDTAHGQMHHIGTGSVRRADCEVCKQSKIDNPKGYYKTFLSEQKCYWNEEMFKDVEAFLEKELLAISTTKEQALAEYRGKIEKEIHAGFMDEATDGGYEQCKADVLSLLNDNKIEE